MTFTPTKNRRKACPYLVALYAPAAKRYARKLCRAHRANPAQWDDIESEAVLGLIQSLELFDPDLGFTILTYASPWIRMRVARYLGWVDAGPATVPLYKRNLASARRPRTYADPVFSFSDQHPSTSLEVYADKIDAKVFKCGYYTDPRDTEDVETDLAAIWKTAHRVLSAREIHILHCRFVRGMILDDIGEELDLTKERIRQIQNEAIETIKMDLARNEVL